LFYLSGLCSLKKSGHHDFTENFWKWRQRQLTLLLNCKQKEKGDNLNFPFNSKKCIL
jgi:hypothetical protein